MSVSSDGSSERSTVWLRAAEWLRGRTVTTPQRDEPDPPGFFDSYPRFFSTSTTNPRPGRLNPRYRALIENNQNVIRDRTILDLASHDGRWTFAALKAGARHALGIEGRANLVAAANSTLHEYGIAEDRYRFIVGDVFEQLDLIAPGSIETIFCFGFFYHTPHHMRLLSKIARLDPQHLIIDTEVDRSTEPIVRLRKEAVALQPNAVTGEPGDPAHAVVGKPTRSALEMMLTSFGWQLSYYDWDRVGINRWDDLLDYREHRRVTVAASRGHILASR